MNFDYSHKKKQFSNENKFFAKFTAFFKIFILFRWCRNYPWGFDKHNHLDICHGRNYDDVRAVCDGRLGKCHKTHLPYRSLPWQIRQRIGAISSLWFLAFHKYQFDLLFIDFLLAFIRSLFFFIFRRRSLHYNCSMRKKMIFLIFYYCLLFLLLL